MTSTPIASSVADSARSPNADDGSYSLLFYGTLQTPGVLSRVIGHRGPSVFVQAAILPAHQLHPVKDADYPGLISTPEAQTNAVRCTLVTGLSSTDVRYLDLFEGDEYLRSAVDAIPDPSEPVITNADRLSAYENDGQALLDLLARLTPDRCAELVELSKADPSMIKKAHVYLWDGGKQRLDLEKTWAFEDFVKTKASLWINGSSGGANREFMATDGRWGEAVTGGDKAALEAAASDAVDPNLAHIEATRRAAQQEHLDVTQHAPPLATPSSMSAGVDPWADPVPGAADVGPKVTSANPWASDSPRPGSPSINQDAGFASAVNAAKEPSKLAEEIKSPAAETDKVDTIDPLAGTGAWGVSSSQTALPGSGTVGGDALVADFHQPGLPRLGHEARRFFAFKEGFTNLNNGSFGAAPKPVRERYRQLQDLSEENIDLFRFRTVSTLLASNKERLANLLHCLPSELSIIANATTGTNAIIRDMAFKDGDAILYLSVGYGAVTRTIRWAQDDVKLSGRGQLHDVAVDVDLERDGNQDILKKVEKHIKEAKAKGLNLRLGIVDAISSMPAARLPWEGIVRLLRSEGILSLIDGAHSIGQIPLDFSDPSTQPDFFVTNAHKWLFAHRGAAVLYVPTRNRKLNRSSLPTSWDYKSIDEGGVEASDDCWGRQWDATGTLDMSSYLSIEAGIDFIESLGGLPRYQGYLHRLALEGGRAAAAVLNTQILELPKDCAMVNVRLPLLSSVVGNSEQDVSDFLFKKGGLNWFFDRLQYEYRTAIPLVPHKGKLWARFSAQIWLEKSDFVWGAKALKELCRRLNSGEASVGQPGGAKAGTGNSDAAEKEEVPATAGEAAAASAEA